MTTPYVYRLTDKLTGRKYIGCRWAEGCEPSDLGVRYFTNSSNVKPLFKEDAKRFEKQILVTGCKTYVIRVEKSLLDMYDCMNSEEFYNRTNNRAIHSEDASKGAFKAHRNRDEKGRSLLALAVGRRNVESGWAAELGRRAVASGNLPRMAAEAGRIGGRIGGKVSAMRLNSQKWRCEVCGAETTPGPLSLHQKVTGHAGKSQIK